jgi:hypothetical protein
MVGVTRASGRTGVPVAMLVHALARPRAVTTCCPGCCRVLSDSR